MTSYYEVLALDSNATIEVIEAAIDDRYNQYRQLVNHLDPNVVEQANRALRQLEEIRATLTNVDKRALYDQTISFGGLADPTAILQASNPNLAVAAPPYPRVPRSDGTDVSAWKCNQCGKVNRIGSKTCSNCGTTLARNCPGFCGNVVLLGEKYCSNCGMSVEEGLAKLQIEFEQAQKQFSDELRTRIQLKRTEIDRLHWFVNNLPFYMSNPELDALVGEKIPPGGLLSIHKSKAVKAIDTAVAQRQEYIRHAERRLQDELAKSFDPLSPRRYSPTTS